MAPVKMGSIKEVNESSADDSQTNTEELVKEIEAAQLEMISESMSFEEPIESTPTKPAGSSTPAESSALAGSSTPA